MNPLLLSTLLLCIWLCWKTFKLIQYRSIAQKTGLPFVLSPVGEHDLLWIILQNTLSPTLERLPLGLGGFVRVTKRGWSFKDKSESHRQLGKVFIVVAPTGLMIHVADAAATDWILTRRREFLKPLEMAKLIDVFGQSVISSEGTDWQRHRRITAPPFNERNNALVWRQAVLQAEQMLSYWTSSSDGPSGITSTTADTSRMALNVLMGAGFGVTYTFCDTLDTKIEGFGMTYRDALEKCMSDVLLLFVPRAFFSLPWLPRKLKEYNQAVREFQGHLKNMVASAKVHAETYERGPLVEDLGRATLMSSLVARARVKDLKDEDISANTLSDSEIYGNLFMFSFAGHETVAMTLAFALYLLAAYPEWQTWVSHEIDQVFEGHEGIERLDYAALYPRLKRCQAIMHEVLRLYPPALAIPRVTDSSPTSLWLDGKEFTIPPHTHIFPNAMALHTSTEYWGPESTSWKPSRWIQPQTDSTVPSSTPSKELLQIEQMVDVPTKGMFVPWADGPRICPGKKFSQVEFSAALAVLLWKHRILVMPRGGETAEEARDLVRRTIEDSGITFTLRMRRPENVGLLFVQR